MSDAILDVYLLTEPRILLLRARVYLTWNSPRLGHVLPPLY